LALIFPETPVFNNDAEEEVYNYIRDYLPQDYVCYFNYHVELREFDICILVPFKGIIMLEVKEWHADRIVQVRDNNCVIYRKRAGQISLTSPLKQADRYRYSMVNLIRERYNKEILVIPAVCYPRITQEEFNNKRLDIVSDEAITIFKEELAGDGSFKRKLLKMFEGYESIPHENLDWNALYDIRIMFENEEDVKKSIEELKKLGGNDGGKIVIGERKIYSLVKYIPGDIGGHKLQEQFDTLADCWKSGVKIHFVSESAETIEQGKQYLENKIEEWGFKKRFSLIDDKGNYRDDTFNFYFYKVNQRYGDSFEIKDGNVKDTELEPILEKIDEESKFNYNQYKVEHAPLKSDMVIKAGAGTGKTYSMISRISYLIYAHGYKGEDLARAIILITFTNEAAANMKRRLQEYFQNYYFLTKNYDSLKMIEYIEDMKISTIHSLTKRILQKYSVKLGLGKDLSIASGKFERGRELLRVLNEYIEKNFKTDDEVIENLKLSMYNLQNRLAAFIDKLDNKNVDAVNDKLDFGNSELKEFDKLVAQVISQTEENLRDEFDGKNQVRLSDLIIKLKNLVNTYGDELTANEGRIDYLFVDEFQDTDDVQIELMRKFRSIFGFNFFVVGDIKQCIYRFRGAEDKAFDILIKGEKWPEYPLNKNYRSDKMLLGSFDKVFEVWGDKDLMTYGDDDRIIGIKELNSEDDIYFEGVSYIDYEDFDNKLFDKVEELKNQLGDEDQIAILVRENWQVEEVRKMFKSRGKYVETDIGGDLYKIQPTIDLYKLVMALQNNKDPKYLVNLYTTSYIRNPLPKVDIYNNKRDREKLLEYFQLQKPIAEWDKYIKDISVEPVLKVLRDIVVDTKPWDTYADMEEEDRERRRRRIYYKRNLDELFEKMVEMASTDYITINKVEKFLEIMILTKQTEESREEYISYSDEKNSVVCMTVHKSKGLEFHSVVIPYCNFNLTDEKKAKKVNLIIKGNKVGYNIPLDEEIVIKNKRYRYLQNNYYEKESEKEMEFKLSEETRILYVAMTRAIKNLVYLNKEGSRTRDSWQNLIKGV
jgi:DNA helicase II / ATP-dependent DNA helicase PcrA